MEVREYIQYVRRWTWLILLAMAVAGSGAYLASRLQEPVYRATTVLLVSESDIVRGDEYAGIQTSRRLAESYVERLKSPDVLEAAAAAAGVQVSRDLLRSNLSVRLLGSAQLIELSVEHTDPETARALADMIPAVFSERNEAQQLERYAASKSSLETELAAIARELRDTEAALAEAQASENPDAATVQHLQGNAALLRDTHSRLLQSYEDVRVAEARSLNNIVVDTSTRVSADPVRPRTMTNVLMGLVLGALVAAGIAMMVEYLDNTVKGARDVEQIVGAPALAAITEIDVSSSQPEDTLVVVRDPRSPAAEAYRQLRTNLMYSLVSRNLSSILITSATPGEGKSVTAANLALSLVQAGKRVILVDADLRSPTQHRLFNVTNRRGLTDLVLEPGRGEQLLQATVVPDLWIVPSGALPPNPSELLGSEHMGEVACWLAGWADYVIYDSPPALLVTDAVVLSRFVDTTVLVVRAGETTIPDLNAAWESLRAVESDLAGVVLNAVRQRNGYDSYYYQKADGHDDSLNGSQLPVEQKTRRQALGSRRAAVSKSRRRTNRPVTETG
jgi:capsular exopolysaccharide synthesis family protein